MRRRFSFFLSDQSCQDFNPLSSFNLADFCAADKLRVHTAFNDIRDHIVLRRGLEVWLCITFHPISPSILAGILKKPNT